MDFEEKTRSQIIDDMADLILCDDNVDDSLRSKDLSLDLFSPVKGDTYDESNESFKLKTPLSSTKLYDEDLMISSGSPEMEDWNCISIESIQTQENQDSMGLEKFKAVNSKVIRPSLENEIELHFIAM